MSQNSVSSTFMVFALYAASILIESCILIFMDERETDVGDFTGIALIFFGIGAFLAIYASWDAEPNAEKLPMPAGEDMRWRSVTDAQLSDFVSQNESKTEVQYTEMGKVIDTYFVNLPVVVVVLIICIVLIAYGYILPAILIFNIPLFACILAKFLRVDQPSFKYVKIPLMKDQIDSLEMFIKRNEIDFQLDIQICIQETNVAEKNALPVLEPFIDDDIRVMVSQTQQENTRPLSWLCAMFSFAVNNYKEDKKPYTYFVVVIDKSKMKSSETTFMNGYRELERKIENNFDDLMSELKNETDNYVIVVRKSESAFAPYVTNEVQLERLVYVAKEIFSMESLR